MFDSLASSFVDGIQTAITKIQQFSLSKDGIPNTTGKEFALPTDENFRLLAARNGALYTITFEKDNEERYWPIIKKYAREDNKSLFEEKNGEKKDEMVNTFSFKREIANNLYLRYSIVVLLIQIFLATFRPLLEPLVGKDIYFFIRAGSIIIMYTIFIIVMEKFNRTINPATGKEFRTIWRRNEKGRD